MACKCTQTTINATAGGAITSPFSACTYPLWVNKISGCTGSALDVHLGNPGANFLFNIGQYDYSEVGYATNNIGINVPNPIHTVSVGGTIDVEQYLHMGDSVASGDTPYSVYLGYRAGETAKNNKNSSYNTVIGNQSLGSSGILNTANHNVAIGYQSLRSLTSGDYNTVIGNGGGYNLTSQSGNVYLGYGQGTLETTESNTLRIGNQSQTPGRSTRPLIQGDFSTSAATIFGSARITTLPPGDDGFVTIDDDGYLHESKYSSGKPISIKNTGIWTANTVDASGVPWAATGGLGYRSVSISGGTNSTSTNLDWAGTRVGIGTGKPLVPLHIKTPNAWVYAQSTASSSYIASISDQDIAYLGMAAGGGVKSGSTTWRLKSFTTPLSVGGTPIGSGFSLMRVSRYVANDSSTQTTTHPFSVLGDAENLDGAMVIRGDNNLGAVGGNRGVGIFTSTPTKELTVVGSISGTGAIHSTDYMKWPNPAESMYLGYGRPSGSTTSSKNTMIGWVDTTTAGAMNGAEGNTAVGWKTINNITSGELNVAIGREAGDSLTTGSLNTFVGAYAGTSITTQNANVYIGYAQGWNLTESSILRIGNNHNFNGEEPLIYGNMNTSGLTINGTVELEGTLTGKGDGNTGGNEYVGVVGGVRATGTIQAPNLKFTNSNEFTSIGMNQVAGSGTTNSVGNTFVGFGINNENALNVSNFNTAVGSKSMQYIGAAASSNTAVGYTSLLTNETGDENTAIGSTSLKDNETGSFNIGIGSSALGGSVTAGNNLAIGNYAMDSSSSHVGEFNIAIGDYTMRAVTTGNNNVAVGRTVQGSLTTGTFNTSIGDFSTASNKTGVHNVALGHKSLFGVTSYSHSYNTSIGSGSLSGITTGGCNVAVGNNSGSGIGLGVAITTGSNNITIGCQTNVKVGTNSNQINIGNIIYGRAINGSPTTNAIGIGSDIPNHPLSVAGAISGSTDLFVKDSVQTQDLVLGTTSAGGKIRPAVNGEEIIFSNATHGSADWLSLAQDLFDFRIDGDSNFSISPTLAQFNSTNTDQDFAVKTDTSNYSIQTDAQYDLLALGGNGGTSIGGYSVRWPTLNGAPTSAAIKTLQVNGTTTIYSGGTPSPLSPTALEVVGDAQILSDLGVSGHVVTTGSLTVRGSISALASDGQNNARINFGQSGNFISGGTSGGIHSGDLELWSANDIELKAADDINLEATGKVEFTQFGATNSSMAIDLNDVPGQAFIQNFNNNEVVGINASTRRLYFLYQGAIPNQNQNWISGEENDGSGNYDLTLGSDSRIVMSATSVGIGTTSPVTKLDVHHDPTGLANNTGGGEVITFGSAGTGYATGNLVQLRGASNWVRADADNTTLQGNLMGIALGAAPSDGILLKGFYKINTADDVATWANGGQLYSSTVVGKITESTGSMGSGDYVRVVGYMTTTTNVIYFNPESTFIVVT
jgi:hypothetical protein|tara:strand:- start:7215 stop:11531 length:4317 start_codon:yes stop_codon:yes gene_type:complete